MLFLYLMAFQAAEKMADENFTATVCEACGAEFSCGARAGDCWCFALELKAATLDDLRENFDGCLCAKCLNKLTDRSDAADALSTN